MQSFGNGTSSLRLNRERFVEDISERVLACSGLNCSQSIYGCHIANVVRGSKKIAVFTPSKRLRLIRNIKCSE